MTESISKNEEINNHKYLFLDHISESTENTLRIVLSVAQVDSVESSVQIGDISFEEVRAITPSSACYEILFESYVAYFVLNESYDTPYEGSDQESWEGKNFRFTSDSRFIQFLETSSISKDWIGNYKHYRIYCQNHVVNVVSLNEPKIKSLVKSSI